MADEKGLEGEFTKANRDIFKVGTRSRAPKKLNGKQVKTLHSLWMSLTRSDLSTVLDNNGIDFPLHSKKDVLVGFLIEGMVPLTVPSKKRTRSDSKDDTADDNRPKNKKSTQEQDAADIQDLLDGNSESDDSAEEEAPLAKKGIPFKKSLLSTYWKAMVLLFCRWGYFTDRRMAHVIRKVFKGEYVPLHLLFESDPLKPKALKVKSSGRLTVDDDELDDDLVQDPICWSILFLRLIALISVCFPDSISAVSLYHSTLLTWFHERRYPFNSILEYEKRLRLHSQRSAPRSWSTVDLQLMARFLLPHGQSATRAKVPSNQLSAYFNSSQPPNPARGPSHRAPSDAPSATPVCFRWRDRKCKFGDKCRFRHSCSSCPGVKIHDKHSCPLWQKKGLGD